MATARPIKLPPRRTGLSAIARRQNLPTLGLAVVALALVGLIGHDIFFPANPSLTAALQTFTVANGTVTNSVSASGTLAPAQQLSLGFKTAGTLTEVDVRSGDHVSAGQVLARIDTTSLAIALQTAQASLASAQATLSNTLSGT
jgi:multidrug efflux pump subunit AcrA (membrane-fusion protein)